MATISFSLYSAASPLPAKLNCYKAQLVKVCNLSCTVSREEEETDRKAQDSKLMQILKLKVIPS